jgi:hypothetical protein
MKGNRPSFSRDGLHNLLSRKCYPEGKTWEQLALHAVEYIAYAHTTSVSLAACSDSSDNNDTV